MSLTSKQKADYLADPNKSPYCGSGTQTKTLEPIVYRGLDKFSRTAHCSTIGCDHTWTDIYTLTAIEESEE